MSEKYTIVQHEKRLFWLQDCPVLLHSYALTKNNTNNSIFLQCKFENIADKPIKAMNIAVKCSDVSHQELANVDNFPYLDINVQPYTLFADKTPVALPNNTTRNVRIIPLKVIFSDDTTWENTSERAYELAEYEQQPISSLGELADQYKRDLHKICIDSEKHNYLPANVNGFTICGCGKVVKAGILSCPACGVTIEKLFGLNNAAALQEHLENYQTAQAKSQQQQKVKKRKLVRWITATGIVAVLAITISLTYSHVKKNAYMKSFEQAQAYSDRFSACETFAAAITDNGTITLTAPYKNIQLDDSDWYDIQYIEASHHSYSDEIIGVRSDDMTVDTQLSYMHTAIENIFENKRKKPKIVQTDKHGDIELMDDGTITSEFNEAEKLKNIVDIVGIYGGSGTFKGCIALDNTGNITPIGMSAFYENTFDTTNWDNIIQLSIYDNTLVGLRQDGTVVATGNNSYGQCDVEDWTDIVAVKAEERSVYGVKSDGTIVGVGYIPAKQNYDLGDLKLW